MIRPSLYVDNCMQVKEDFDYVFKKHFSSLKLKNVCTVLDIGCGPGNTMTTKLFPLLPKSLKLLVGVDKSEPLLEYAKVHYQTDSRILYQKMDIAKDRVPDEFNEAFDNIFSFYTFHFISDFKAGFANVHKMLKSGGEMFISFLGTWEGMKIYQHLASISKWKSIFSHHYRITAPTYSTYYPENYLSELLTELGFEVHLCEKVPKIYVYPKQNFINMITAIDSFNLPKEKELECSTDIIEFMEMKGLVHTDQNDEIFVHYPYTLITVRATKE